MAHTGSYGSLLFRVVGVPTLAGRVLYNQTLQGSRLEASGNYSRGYFLEAFTEYAYAVNRRSDLGLFARFNCTRGTTNLNLHLVTGGGTIFAHDTFSLSLFRNDWTIG